LYALVLGSGGVCMFSGASIHMHMMETGLWSVSFDAGCAIPLYLPARRPALPCLLSMVDCCEWVSSGRSGAMVGVKQQQQRRRRQRN
jgi:hypothetical protein